MTAATRQAAPQPQRRGLLHWLRRGVRALTPDQLLLRQFKLTKAQRAEMYARALSMTQVAGPVGSSIYFLVTQVSYQVQYGHTLTILWYLRDAWNRLPVHIDNLLGVHWFGTSQQASPTWVIARHDARHVLIGILITLMVGSLTVGMGKVQRKRLSNPAIAARFALAVPAAIPGAAIGIAFFAWLLPSVFHVDISAIGANVGGWPGEWVGKGSWTLTIIGILAGLGVHRVLRPAQDTLQLMSIERKIASQATQRPWWRLVYGPNYTQRYDWAVASHHVVPKVPQRRGVAKLVAVVANKAMDAVQVAAAPVFLFLLGFGVWLLYWGPAATATGH